MNCRGCAGTGIGQHVPARIVQVLERGIEIQLDTPREYNGVHSIQVTRRHLWIAAAGEWPNGKRERLVFRGPLAEIIAELERREAEGYVIVSTYSTRPSNEQACEWCHGTGVPQLSAHALKQLATGK